jgi:hypothetical protein
MNKIVNCHSSIVQKSHSPGIHSLRMTFPMTNDAL